MTDDPRKTPFGREIMMICKWNYGKISKIIRVDRSKPPEVYYVLKNGMTVKENEVEFLTPNIEL